MLTFTLNSEVAAPVILEALPIPCTLNSLDSTLLSQSSTKNVGNPFM